jgi:glycosyltransferase involved in cell wall biosynthesis
MTPAAPSIVHYSASDLSGGAARSAYRLHVGLARAGADSRMFVRKKFSIDPTVQELQLPAGRVRAARRWLRRTWLRGTAPRPLPGGGGARPAARGAERYSDFRSSLGREALTGAPRSAIAHLHWIAEFLEAGQLRALPAPALVWTLHDVNPFTGGCHFPAGCARFQAQCGCCPQLASPRENDASRRGWRTKATAYPELGSRLTIVCPSRWIAEQAARSSLLREFPRIVVPYGIDTETFQPHDRAHERRELGLRSDQRVIVAVADQLESERKGFRFLHEAVLPLLEARPDALLVTVGEAATLPAPHPRWRHLGAIYEEWRLARVLAAADVFAIASLEDNLPNTALEAMACGLPIVAFASGGLTDLVEEGGNGRLVAARDVAGLRAALAELLAAPEICARQGAAARARALRHHTLAAQAEAMLAVYAAALARHPGSV